MNTLTLLMCDLASKAAEVGETDPDLCASMLHLIERLTEETNAAISVALRASCLHAMTNAYAGCVNQLLPGLEDVRVGQLYRHRSTGRGWRVVGLDRRRENAIVVPSPLRESKPWLSVTVLCERLRRDYRLEVER